MEDASSPAPAAAAAAGTVVVPPEAGRTVHAFGDTLQIKLDAAQTGGAMTVALNHIPPHHGPPPHVHRSEDETFLVLEGSFQFMNPDGTWSSAVGPGGTAYTPRGVRHCFRNSGDTPARAWIITTPSGFERFFERCAEVFAAAGVAGGPPDMARIIAISTEHGIEYVPSLGGGPPAPAMPPGV